MKRVKKGDKGYLNNRKIFYLMLVLAFVILAAVFFFTGYVRFNTTKTVFTVMAVLMVLPAAKQFVIYIVIAPYKSVDEIIYNRIKDIINENDICMIADMVITSQEKITNIDIICVKGGRVIGYAPNKKVDINYISKYLMDLISKYYKINQVKIYADVIKYEKAIEELKTIDANKYDMDVARFILTQSV